MPGVIPYGTSNFAKLIRDGAHYVDRTGFIAQLEQRNDSYHFYLRPRRFGKSLMVSVLEHYYGKHHKDKFDALFGQYHIGQHPTPRASSYLVLKFDFSGIRSDSLHMAREDFTEVVKAGVASAMNGYEGQYPPSTLVWVMEASSANIVMLRALSLLQTHFPAEKAIVLIDEYDHFANQIIARSPTDFQEIVGANGFVRAFYEMLKKGTGDGIIDRIFITGVSPITLDNLTSGFNIATDLTRDLHLHDMMGFTGAEVEALLRMAGVPDADLPRVMADAKRWYDGYLFNEDAPERLYNPDMVLYFANTYSQYRTYPASLLDTNVATDYGKVRRFFNVGKRSTIMAVMGEVVEKGGTLAAITEKYSFERGWTRDDFASLLFYMGLVTIKGARLSRLQFGIPNLVMEGLYYGFFRDELLHRAGLERADFGMEARMEALALNDDLRPLTEALGMVLEALDNRDARQFNELSAKAALLALAMPTGVYAVQSEYPIGRGYADVFISRRPPFEGVRHQHLLEIKHLKKKDATEKAVAEKAEEGRRQLRAHLAHPDMQVHDDLMGWLIVVVGHEVWPPERVRLGEV